MRASTYVRVRREMVPLYLVQLYLGVVYLALKLLVLGDLPYRLHEVLLQDRRQS